MKSGHWRFQVYPDVAVLTNPASLTNEANARHLISIKNSAAIAPMMTEVKLQAAPDRLAPNRLNAGLTS